MKRAALCLVAVLAATPALAAEGRFRRVEVVDGDTVILPVSAGFATTLKIRILGIDTPERNGRCEYERRMAMVATDRLRQLTANRVRVWSELEVDAYGRFLGRLYDRQGRDLSAVMLQEGHARPLADGQARQPWCPAGTAR